MNKDSIEKKFIAANQAQVFAFWEELNDAQKARLLGQAQSVDLPELALLNKTLPAKNCEAPVDFEKLSPAPYLAIPENKDADPQWLEAKKIGEAAIKAGRLAVFAVAGGQGTRLGFDAPKGCFPISPVKHKTLFQIFAEKILYASRKYSAGIPWLIMTSKANDKATRQFFKDNNFFGLNEGDVIFFAQGLMPAVDKSGKIILESKASIALAPDGHGGCLRAMCRSGALAELKKRNIDCISFHQVDNPLADIVDPFFVGFHLRAKSEMSSKMVAKAYASEKVGLFCLNNGRLCVVEYSDLPESFQRRTDADGRLRFIAGNIAMHILDAGFVESLGGENARSKLPFHRADKKIPFVNGKGDVENPDSANGMKFEMFVFDALPMAKNSIVMESMRADEFSPVKNAEGVDSPQTCKDDQLRRFARWAKLAGLEPACDKSGLPKIAFEVSPLFAASAADFAANWQKLAHKPELKDGLYIE